MSRYLDHKNEIKAQLAAITGIGNVYDAPKNCMDEASFKDVFVKSGVINTVTFTRAGGTEKPDTTEDDEIISTAKVDNWTITFFYGFKDDAIAPSEYSFQGLIESIEDRFRFLQDLNSKAYRSYPLTRQYAGMWQVAGGVLCHKAEWTLPVESRIINAS
jgi:hypothetical protein